MIDPDPIPRAPSWADVPTVPPDVDLEDIDQWTDDDGEVWQRDGWGQWFSMSELEREAESRAVDGSPVVVHR